MSRGDEINVSHKNAWQHQIGYPIYETAARGLWRKWKKNVGILQRTVTFAWWALLYIFVIWWWPKAICMDASEIWIFSIDYNYIICQKSEMMMNLQDDKMKNILKVDFIFTHFGFNFSLRINSLPIHLRAWLSAPYNQHSLIIMRKNKKF